MGRSDRAELPPSIKHPAKDDAPLMEAALRLFPTWDKDKAKLKAGTKLEDGFEIVGTPTDKELKVKRNGKTFTIKKLEGGETLIRTDNLDIVKARDGSRTYWDTRERDKLLGFRSADHSTTYMMDPTTKKWSVFDRKGALIADHPFQGKELDVEMKDGKPTGKLTLKGEGTALDVIRWLDGRTGVFDKSKTDGALTVTYPDNRVETFDKDGGWRSTRIGDTTYRATYWKYDKHGKELKEDDAAWKDTPWSIHRIDKTVGSTTTTPFQRVADPTTAGAADVLSITRTPEGLITATRKDGQSTTINPIEKSETVRKPNEIVTTYENGTVVEVKKGRGDKATARIFGPGDHGDPIYTAELDSFSGPPFKVKTLKDKDGRTLLHSGKHTKIEMNGGKITATFDPPKRPGDHSPKLRTATYNLDGTRDLTFNDGHKEKRTVGGWMVSSERGDKKLNIEYQQREDKIVADKDGAAPSRITAPGGAKIEHSKHPITSADRYTLTNSKGDEKTYKNCRVDKKGVVHLYDDANVHWVLDHTTGEPRRFSGHADRDRTGRRLGEGTIPVGDELPGRTHKRHGIDHDVRRIKIDDKRDVTLDSSRFTTRSGTMERSVVRNPEGGQMSRILKDAETGEIRSLYWKGKDGKHYCLENEAGRWQKYELTSGTWRDGKWKPVGDRKDLKFEGQDSHGRVHATLTERGKTVHRIFGRSLTVYMDMDDKQYEEYKRTGKVKTKDWKPNRTF